MILVIIRSRFDFLLTLLFTCFIFLFVGSTALEASASNTPDYEFSFSSEHSNGLPIQTNQTQFNCSDQIYSIINASNLSDEPVNATIIWRNPTGQIQEQTPVNLFPVEGKAYGWAWLKLHKATGAALLSFIDDSIGMDEFIGDWNIELHIDNKKVTNGKFNVLC